MSFFSPKLLQGHRALITGGGTGIGRAIAQCLAECGADLLLVARDISRLRLAADELRRDTGREVEVAALDIRDREGIENLGVVLRQRGLIPDVLVNNAGGQFAAPAREFTPKGWNAVLELNLTGTWNMTQVFGAMTLELGRGVICQIVVVHGRGFPGIAHSASARAGVIELTRTLAFEWGPAVRLNCVAPGPIETLGFASTYDDDVISTIRGTPLRRSGTAAEVAQAVAFLVSPAASYITGELLHVAGGQQLQGAESRDT